MRAQTQHRRIREGAPFDLEVMRLRVMHLDIETYSSAALPKCGVYRYCDALDFEILLLSYAFDDAPVVTVDMACGLSLIHISEPTRH